MKVLVSKITGTQPRREHGDLEGLKSSIADLGLINPITVDQHLKLLAGRRRYQALLELYGPDYEVDCHIIPINGDRLRAFAVTLAENIHRKDLTDPEVAVTIKEYDELKRMLEGSKPAGNPNLLQQNKLAGWTQAQTAKDLAISQPAVAKAIQIAEAIEKFPELAGWGSGQAILREHRKRTVEAPAWPAGKYRVMYADPPWQYSNTMPGYFAEQADHYPTMSLSELMALPIQSIALDDAVLFLWATSPILEDAFKVIRAWGFEYKASFVWDKVKHNMGHFNSVRHEFLLVATRGVCQPDHLKLFDSVQTVERGDHSTKPEIFRTIIDTLYQLGDRIELFARAKAEGWAQYGNEC